MIGSADLKISTTCPIFLKSTREFLNWEVQQGSELRVKTKLLWEICLYKGPMVIASPSFPRTLSLSHDKHGDEQVDNGFHCPFGPFPS